jgi:hypothetical protein
MFSPGMTDANQDSKDVCFYYELLTRHRRIPPDREDCWVIVAMQLTEKYDSEYSELSGVKLQQVTELASRNCSGVAI